MSCLLKYLTVFDGSDAVDLHTKLLEEFDFDSYQSTILLTLHEISTDTYKFSMKLSEIGHWIYDIKWVFR
jgi:hypothetical protein